MKELHPDIGVGILLLAFWLLAFQYWWGRDSELRLHNPECFKRRLIGWLVTAVIIVLGTVTYHVATTT